MSYELKVSEVCYKQIEQLGSRTVTQLYRKLQMVKLDPFRFKALKGFGIPVFRLRFSDQRRDMRLIYAVTANVILLLCILERSDDYRELVRIMKDLNINVP